MLRAHTLRANFSLSTIVAVPSAGQSFEVAKTSIEVEGTEIGRDCRS